jgi:hypothetical protein
MFHRSLLTTLTTARRRLQLNHHLFKTMTTDPSTNINSPPNSPPPKRVKTTTTMSPTAAVTTLDQAPPLLIKKLSDKARLPTRGSAFAAGYDLYAAHETIIPARGKALVDTDISMAVPAGTCMSPFPSLPPVNVQRWKLI